ncbi:GH32 C-terminal domain-containing protein [Escherichia coli]
MWRYLPSRKFIGCRSIPLPQRDTLALRIFIDTSSVEVFINDREAVMSSRIYPQPEERELSALCLHGVAVLQHGALWLLGQRNIRWNNGSTAGKGSASLFPLHDLQ